MSFLTHLDCGFFQHALIRTTWQYVVLTVHPSHEELLLIQEVIIFSRFDINDSIYMMYILWTETILLLLFFWFGFFIFLFLGGRYIWWHLKATPSGPWRTTRCCGSNLQLLLAKHTLQFCVLSSWPLYFPFLVLLLWLRLSTEHWTEW